MKPFFNRLKPLNTCIFQRLVSRSGELAEELDPLWLLPLLQDLSEDLWPRGVLGDIQLDGEIIARKAFRSSEMYTFTYMVPPRKTHVSTYIPPMQLTVCSALYDIYIYII